MKKFRSRVFRDLKIRENTKMKSCIFSQEIDES